MAHSWLYKLKGISRKHLPSSPKHLSSSSTDASSSRKLRDILRLSSSAHHPHGSSSPPKSSWNHRSKSSYANGISNSTAGSPTHPVSFSDQNYGFSGDPESHSVDIKDDHSVRNLGDVSEDSENSSPILVETVKQPPFDLRTHQKLKKPKASSSGIRIRTNSPKITRKKTKGRTFPESKKGIRESFAIVLTSENPWLR